ncbi:hypothetical protein CLV96_4029 [Leptospira meyeri]|uniref:Uncharacterized protein n=1 Tax=Leptospira meyeri TaxID=29508 RepID=A0A4V3HHL6_LEPME|nr:hypothetical protein [Leptospira meyeri]EKJ88543.1 hypothetical protein LEP1GSC017_3972 [Leptospira meyeri serovar Hardjo str. Went 5]TDY65845.1 hypothetical protein CLV96_4029 [Leptospira meyeri]
MTKILTFLDIMGWKNLIQRDKELAIDLLQNYSSQIKFHADYETGRISSFQNLIPMSDSVLISSESNNIFIEQLSEYLLNCYEYSVRLNSARNQDDRKDELFAAPLLFRGGISAEDFTFYNTITVKNGEVSKDNTNIAGLAMVNAVLLEKSEKKGPRIFLESRVVSELNEIIRNKYVNQYEEGKFEILWPIIELEKNQSDNFTTTILSFFLKLYLPTEKLLNHFKESDSISKHYSEFINLLDTCITRFYESHPSKDDAIKEYERLKKEYPRQSHRRITAGKRFAAALTALLGLRHISLWHSSCFRKRRSSP